MPRPFAGAAGEPSSLSVPAPSAGVVFASGSGFDSGSGVDSGAGFGSGSDVGGELGAAAAGAFLTPGRFAPAAMPSPLTGAAGALASVSWTGPDVVSGSAAVADCVAASGFTAVFFAPGRLAPPAMPSPLTGAAGADSVLASGSEEDVADSVAPLGCAA